MNKMFVLWKLGLKNLSPSYVLLLNFQWIMCDSWAGFYIYEMYVASLLVHRMKVGEDHINNPSITSKIINYKMSTTELSGTTYT